MRDLIQSLCARTGVSSREEEVRQFIRTQVEPWADFVREDVLGNLIVFKKGRISAGKKVLLDAPMDETGVMVSGFTDDGALRFQTVGPVDRRYLIGKRVYLGEQLIPGVFGMKPIHLSTKEERKSVPKLKELYIDIGAKDRESAQARISLGDIGFFAGGAQEFGENLWKGKSLNSRIPCAVLVKLLREELPMDCTFVFGAQELVGTRGAFGAAFAEKPDIVLCLDGIAAEDGPMFSEGKRGCAVGHGAVIPVSDRMTRYDRELFILLRQLAEERQIPWQIQAAVADTSAARGYQRSRTGVRVAGLATAVRYLHAPTEVASLEDGEALLCLTRAFLEALAEENQK